MTVLEQAFAHVDGATWINGRHMAFTASCDVAALVGGQVRCRCREGWHSEAEIRQRWRLDHERGGDANGPEVSDASSDIAEPAGELDRQTVDGAAGGLSTQANAPPGGPVPSGASQNNQPHAASQKETNSKFTPPPSHRQAPSGSARFSSSNEAAENALPPEPEWVQPIAHAQGLPATSAPDILRRVPPQNVEAEQSYLGAILLAPEMLRTPTNLLERDDFYRESHREIFAAMLKLSQEEQGIDAVTLAYELRSRGVLEEVGGPGYLAELAACVPTAANIGTYAAIIRECALKRQLIAQAMSIASLAYDGVSTDALLGEAERLLLPAIKRSNRLPELISHNITVMSGPEFFERQRNAGPRHWLVDELLARKEISLWSGKVEAGKTTCMRTLVMDFVRGDFFLGRHTYPGRVLYAMLDADGEDVTYGEFRRLGWNPHEDPIDFIIDPVMCLKPNCFEQFHARLLELKSQLVVIDPLGRFQQVENSGDGGFLGYSMTYAMARFSELARQTDSHFALLHHIPRGRSDAAEVSTAGFGSIAISGGCNNRFVFIQKPGGIYTVQSSKGKGAGFVPFEGEQTLTLDPDTHHVSLRGSYSWKDQADAIKPRILELINASEEPLSALELGREAGVQRGIAGSAAKSLYRDGLVDLQIIRGSNKHLFLRKPQSGNLPI